MAELGWNAKRGTVLIHDVSGLASLLGVPPAAISDPTSFKEGGDLISPWPVAIAVARRATEREPHKVLADVEKAEADAIRYSTYGRWSSRRGREDDWVPPEVCQRVDAERGQPIEQSSVIGAGPMPSIFVPRSRRYASTPRAQARWRRRRLSCSVVTATRVRRTISKASCRTFGKGMVRGN